VVRQAVKQTIKAPETRVGQVVAGSFKLTELVAHDTSGDVYKTVSVLNCKTLCIRIFPLERGNEAFGRRLTGVVAKAAMIHHSHVAAVHRALQTDDGTWCVVGEWIDGPSLASILQAQTALPWNRTTRLTLQICRGLHAAHRHGLIHRNLTAANCMFVHAEGSDDHVKLINFGLTGTAQETQLVLADASTTQVTSGSDNSDPRFRAPELAQGHAPDPRSDVYALGVLMYKMLCGQVPFDSPHELEIVAGHLTQPPRPPSEVAPAAGIPAPLEALVLKALCKDPQLRFQNARELTEALIASERALLSAAQIAGNSTQELRAAEASLTKGSILPDRSRTRGRPHRRLTTRRHMLPGTRNPTPSGPLGLFPERDSTLEFLPEDAPEDESTHSHLFRLLVLVGLLMLTVAAVFFVGEG